MVVATGFFDGVHLGHRLVIRKLVEMAKNAGDESLVVTFWPHPRNVLQKDARQLRLLTSLSEKKRMLGELGVDRVEVLPFTREFSRMTTLEYLRDVVVGRFGARCIVLGYDNRMGNDATDADFVEKTAISLGLEVVRMDNLRFTDQVAISSTKIRDRLQEGDVVQANQMLGYNYSLCGVVVGGHRLGRTLGYPTANMQLYEPLKLIPARGVYFVKVNTLGREFFGMCNIGCRPTLGEGKERTIETHIFDFDEDIYGLDIEVSFLSKIRDEVRFGTLEELKCQLSRDKEVCLEEKLKINN